MTSLFRTLFFNQPSGSLDETVVLGNRGRTILRQDIVAPSGAPAVAVEGDNALLTVLRQGSISAPDADNTAVQVNGEAALITNFGSISGAFNGISSEGDRLRLLNIGTISSDSRAVDISDGDGSRIVNFGDILGTGNQRNGTLYVDGTVDDLLFINTSGGVVDAGEDNLGDAVAVQVGAADDPSSSNINIINNGLFQGRGDGPDVFADGERVEANGSSGLRFFNGSDLPQASVSGSVTNKGTITSEVTVGFLGGVVVEDGVAFEGQITNGRDGLISGPFNGLYVGNAEHDLEINNFGRIESGSRAVNIDGTGVTLNNSGSILGTDNQRNGTVYSDDTANFFSINNSGTIDAGEGNNGAAISLSLGEVPLEATIENSGTIQGRAEDGEILPPTSPEAGDGIRLEGIRGTDIEGGVTFAPSTFTGDIVNSGTIASADNVSGSTAGFHAVNGVSFQGTLTNTEDGVISGALNGVYFGNPVDGEGADHTGGIFRNEGLVSSDSRALNIDGIGLTVENSGSILGTGNQRNGTVYSDDTSNFFSINNSGTIDAGEGNNGAAISLSLGEVPLEATIENSGTIQGRAEDGEILPPTSPEAGDGIRLEGVRGTDAEGGVTFAPSTFTGDIVNSGTISSADNVSGSTAGFHAVNGVSFQGTLTNTEEGVISGAQNGVYFGNPVDGEGADHTGGVFRNEGLVTSDSRAVNIDGIGLTVENSGSILGTGNQRNGTIYSDDTANLYTINNSGTIDAGEGNNGAAISLSLGDTPVEANIVNSGTIQGRAEDGEILPPTSPQAGDGIRLEGVRGTNAEGDVTFAPSTFTGDIVNSGTISSADNVSGSTAGFHAVNGVSFQGTLTNTEEGVISGAQNGVYFGNPVDGEGADHTGGIFRNEGLVTSDSRAVNIDGTGLSVENSGSILGTGDQRNGTVYSDATADNYTIDNQFGGVIDAGEGNNGAGISLQTGDIAGDVVTASVNNDGIIQGRGDAPSDSNLAGDGIRLFAGASGGVTFQGDLNNQGDIIASQRGIAILEGVSLDGTINNSGTISGEVASIDVRAANEGVTVNNQGILNGDVLLSDFNDVFNGDSGSVNGSIAGFGGNDLIVGGLGDDIISGGAGNDTLTGGAGADTFVFAPEDLGIDVISDFQLGVDSLDFSAFSLGTSALQSAIDSAVQIGSDAQFSIGESTTILEDIQANALQKTDFTV